MRSRRRAEVMRRFIKVVALVYVTRQLRLRAMQQGWHNSVGTPETYISRTYLLFKEALSRGKELEASSSTTTVDQNTNSSTTEMEISSLV